MQTHKYMNQIKLIEKVWKTGLAILIAGTLSFGGLFLNLKATSAADSPLMTVDMKANDDNDVPDQGWKDTLSSEAGHRISFGVEIHNTKVDTEAKNVHVKVGFPTEAKNTLNIPVNISADNAAGASDSVTVNVASPASGAKIKYVPNSTRLYWDMNGDGVKEYNNTPLVDGIVNGGLTLGDQKGCNQYIIQVTFLAELEGQQPQPSPSPSPTPSPTPSPSPTPAPSPSPTPSPVAPTPSPLPSQPPAGGPTGPTQNVYQNVNQTVNVTAPAAAVPEVKGASIPLKQPETGAGVLGMTAMFGAAPIGLALARYGRGRMVIEKKEEELAQIAGNSFKLRQGKRMHA